MTGTSATRRGNGRSAARDAPSSTPAARCSATARSGADQQLFHLAEIEVADPDRFLIHPGRTDLVRQSVDIDRAPAAVVIDECEMNPVAGVIDRPHHAGQRNRREVAAVSEFELRPGV